MKRQKEGGFLIAKIHQLTDRVFNKILKTHKLDDINPAQGRILFSLWNKDNIPIHELSVKTQLKKSTLTSMLHNLEKRNFIRRIPSKVDKREIIIKLAVDKHNFKKRYLDTSKEMTELFYNGFNEEEIQHFEGYLRRILNNLIQFELKSKT